MNMDVETLLQLQSQSNEIETKEPLAPFPEMVNTSTQTLSWNELTLQMISDVVSHQVIHMKKQDPEQDTSTTPAAQTLSPPAPCKHVNGMTWNDIATMISGNHNILCSQTNGQAGGPAVGPAGGPVGGPAGGPTGGKLKDNVIQITVDWPSSYVDYMKTTIEIHFPTQSKPQDNSKMGRDLVGVKGQTMTPPLLHSGGGDNTDRHDPVEVKGQTIAPQLLYSGGGDNTGGYEVRGQRLGEMQLTDSAAGVKGHARTNKLDEKGDQDELKMSMSETGTCAALENLTSEEEQNQTMSKSIPKLSQGEQPIRLSRKVTTDAGSEPPHQVTIKSPKSPENVECTDDGEDDSEIQMEKLVLCESVSDNQPNISTETRPTSEESEPPKVGKSKQQIYCKECGEVFETLSLLNEHVQIHSKKLSTKKQSGKNKQHKATRVSNNQAGFKCSVCSKVFSSRWKLSIHERTHAPGYNVHPCPDCDRICKNLTSLKRHQLSHQPPKYSCPECGMKFRIQEELRRHRSKEHNIFDKYVCDICGSSYKNKNTYKDHLIEHSGKEFLCDMCGKKFARPELLRFHTRRHKMKTQPKSFKCSMCTKQYVSDRQLKLHVRLTHIKERNHACEICDKKFFYRYQMEAHEKAHAGFMQYRCQYCNKGFLKNASLVAHEMVHTGKKPHKCRHCQKGFATKGHLKRHERIHVDGKPERVFECTVCHAKFRYVSQKRQHEKRHTGVKDHKCGYCTKDFVSRSELLRHLRTHTDGKPHQCQYCEQAFAKKAELLAHELSHGALLAHKLSHGDEPSETVDSKSHIFNIK